MSYRYGADGQRATKYSAARETLYFDSMWTGTADWPNGWRWSKHIYVGSTRIATRLGYDGCDWDLDYKRVNTYYYHTDHLGSVHLVSDYQGRVYEHIEYTPYGELWVEHGPEGLEAVPYRFTGKELDEETGLYYYGAQYLNPRTSRWISADPGLETYLPETPINDLARQRNQNLPGQGGVFTPINLAAYHYAANNPARYYGPTGDSFIDFILQGPRRAAATGRYVARQAIDFTRFITGKQAFSETPLNYDVNAANYAIDQINITLKIFTGKDVINCGGANKDLPRVEGIVERHHMVSQAAIKASGIQLTTGETPAIVMSVPDHRRTLSAGGFIEARKYREEQTALLKQCKFLEAFEREAELIQATFGMKYSQQIKEARAYLESLPPEKFNVRE